MIGCTFPSLEPSNNSSIADWIILSLYPFKTYLAGSLIPPGFEAYARILHPAVSRTSGHPDVRWSDVAAWSGQVYHSEMQFESIADPVGRPGNQAPPWDGQLPGALPLDQVGELAQILRGFTNTPERVWYCVWEGYGGLPDDELRPDRARVRRPYRDYLLYQGALGAVTNFFIHPFHHSSPEYWWPDDNSWCVATDVDILWTYVGGSTACIESLLQHNALEVVPGELLHGLTVDSDRVNRRG